MNQQISIPLEETPSGDAKHGGTSDVAAASEDGSTKAERQELFLPVSNFVWFYPEEMRIIDHPAFQRLGRINQLGQAHLVFRGATHKRIEHSLGAVDILQRMIDAIRHNSVKKKRHPKCAKALRKAEERFTRLGTLLHDIGHLAAGHTLEDELGLVGKHDADGRLNNIFESPDFKNVDDKTLGELIDDNYKTYVPDDLKQQGITPSVLVRLLIRKPPKNRNEDKLKKQQEVLEKSKDLRLKVCSKMIGDTVCADLLDYLHRDWFHIGKPKPFDERILQYMEIRNVGESAAGNEALPSDEFVINLGQSPKIRTDGVSAILELLEWRYQLAETVLFHRTKLSAGAMLDRALYELWGDDRETNIEEIILPLSDEQLIDVCAEIANSKLRKVENRKSAISNGRVSQLKAAHKILTAIKKRELYTDLRTYSYGQLDLDVRQEVKRLYGIESANESDKESPKRRTTALRLLEDDFGLPRGSIAMYCAEMNPKLAEVSIAVGDEVTPFYKYEQDNDNVLSGGHLEAQIRRFTYLWRVHFFVDRKTKVFLEENNLLITLNRAIRSLILGDLRAEDREQVTWELANTLANHETSIWHGRAVRSPLLELAARGDESVAQIYPTGLPRIQSYFEDSKRSK